MTSEMYEENGTTIIVPQGRLDTLTAPAFGKELEELLSRSPGRCLIDMGRVDYLSSSGLRVLLAAAQAAGRKEIDFGVFALNDMVSEVFTMSGFNHFIPAYADKKEALSG